MQQGNVGEYTKARVLEAEGGCCPSLITADVAGWEGGHITLAVHNDQKTCLKNHIYNWTVKNIDMSDDYA